MISKTLKIAIVILSLFGCANHNAQNKAVSIADYNQLSQQFLGDIKAGKSTEKYVALLANTTLEELSLALKTDQQKLAFWVNIYNAYIQLLLSEKPELYKNRQAFFNQDRILIAGEKISFAKIEHGIIRKSQWSLGLGKIPKLFVDKFERKLRVKKRDYRIHFALNCGAKDCPPVAIYEVHRLEEQFTKGTARYLKATTEYDAASRKVAISALFSWFRGDFGNKKGVKAILKQQQLIPSTKDIELDYKNYDWTLDLDNWITL